jgi:hypothetical protein
MTLDPEIQAALRRLDPGQPAPDLTDKAWRRAMAEGRPPSFAERFVLAGRRMVLAGALASAAIWIMVLRDEAGEHEPAVVAMDPRELALSAWAGEGLP